MWNGKQWKCHTDDSADWNSRENAKMWRKDLADTINATNEQLGIAVHWEHRSFKEQGIDREPTIRIGAIANARLDLPIVSGKHLRKISGRTSIQSAANAERFITTRKIDSFESLAKFTADKEQQYGQLEMVHLSKGQKLNRLKELSKIYALYAPIQATYKESQSWRKGNTETVESGDTGITSRV